MTSAGKVKARIKMQEAGASTPPESRALIYTTALTCGLFLALTVHIGLTAAGFGLAGAAVEVFLSGRDQINTALAWWAVGIAGCLGSLAAIAVARQLHRPGLRIMRLALMPAFICLLAVAGRKAAAPAGSEAALTTAVNLAAMMLGGFMAFFAAHFAARR
jgi:hypothetical protein